MLTALNINLSSMENYFSQYLQNKRRINSYNMSSIYHQENTSPIQITKQRTYLRQLLLALLIAEENNKMKNMCITNMYT